MQLSLTSSTYSSFLLYVFLGLCLATPSSSSSLSSLAARARSPAADIEAISGMHAHGTNNATNGFDRCYVPLPGLTVVQTQDALIALGQLANDPSFDVPRTWYDSPTLARWKTAQIQLLKHSNGQDVFSRHDLALKAIAIFWHCIVQDSNGLGGSLHVGSKGIYYLTFHAPIRSLDSKGSTTQSSQMR